MEVKSGGYLPSREAAKEISVTSNDNQANNCFSIYQTDIKKISLLLSIHRKMLRNLALEARFFFLSNSEVNSNYYLLPN